jgi:ABC-type Fe3+ transport system permease subunit
MADDDLIEWHPNAPRRGPVLLAFSAVVIAGVLGALIGYGLVDASCSEQPSRLEQLLTAAIPGYHAHTRSCTLPLAGATLLGALIAAVGTGVVAVLVLRAMGDWRAPNRDSSGE